MNKQNDILKEVDPKSETAKDFMDKIIESFNEEDCYDILIEVTGLYKTYLMNKIKNYSDEALVLSKKIEMLNEFHKSLL